MPALIVAIAGLAMPLAGPAAGAMAGSGVTERVSISSTGTQSDEISGRIGRPAVSGDDSTVAFFTLASNLGPNDTDTCAINDQVSFTDHPGSVPTSTSTTASQSPAAASLPRVRRSEHA